MTPQSEQDVQRWLSAVLAAKVLAVDPAGIGGVWISGPRTGAAQVWLDAVQSFLEGFAPVKRLPLSVSDGRLYGGLDLAATLAAGRPVAERGVLADADGGVVLLAGVENARRAIISALAHALDTGRIATERDGLAFASDARIGVIALDEGTEARCEALRDRLALMLDFTGLRMKDFDARALDREDIHGARARLNRVVIPDEILLALCETSMALGVVSGRAGVLVTRVARCIAALARRVTVTVEDAEAAVRLVLAPRATRLPSEAEDETQAEPPPEQPESDREADQPDKGEYDQQELEELLIAAALASLPDRLLEQLRQGKNAAARSAAAAGRAGLTLKVKHHGRRSRSRRGDPRDGAPLDIIETLRAAAPWQALRRRERLQGSGASAGVQHRLEVRRGDFRVRTFKNHRETSTIFVVDASGSAALHRLAEAKGAIELLLADCYARRDSVALIAFRGKAADVLLPPTRSLARVKRSLAALPGGGGTPLASATECAASLADAARRKGQTPAIVFLTDGKANIARDGAASRQRATDDALAAARALRASGLASIVIDTSPRPAEQSRAFAAEMGARYIALPHANAARLSDAVKAGTVTRA